METKTVEEQVWLDHEEWVAFKEWKEELERKLTPEFILFMLGGI